eukprot:9498713-Pyramimonas_sp.AAC.2
MSCEFSHKCMYSRKGLSSYYCNIYVLMHDYVAPRLLPTLWYKISAVRRHSCRRRHWRRRCNIIGPQLHSAAKGPSDKATSVGCEDTRPACVSFKGAQVGPVASGPDAHVAVLALRRIRCGYKCPASNPRLEVNFP